MEQLHNSLIGYFCKEIEEANKINENEENWDWTARILKGENLALNSPKLNHDKDTAIAKHSFGETLNCIEHYQDISNYMKTSPTSHEKEDNDSHDHECLVLLENNHMNNNKFYYNCEKLVKKEDKNNLKLISKIAKKTTKIYTCEQTGCSKTYKTKENLTLHFKNKHLNIKPYKCSFCPASYSHRNGKIYHERKNHLKTLPYCCSFLGKNRFFNEFRLSFALSEQVFSCFSSEDSSYS